MARTLKELFQECTWGGQAQAPENAGEVCAVIAGADKNSILCKLQFPALVSRKALEDAERKIQSTYHLSRVRLLPQYEKQELDDAYVQSLQEYVRLKNPASCGFLSQSRWTWEEQQLEVEIPEESNGYLSAVLQSLHEVIHQETGMNYAVKVKSFSSVENSDLQMEQEEKERNKELDKLIQEQQSQVPAGSFSAKPQPTKSRTENGHSYRKAKAVPKNDKLIWGKMYEDRRIPIRDVANELGRVTIEGEIFACETREIKKKDLVVFSFDITDHSSSICVKRVLDREKAQPLIEGIKSGMYVRVQGQATFDNWAKEMIIQPNGIEKATKKMRLDTAEQKRVELHLHTNMSAMDGVSSTESLIRQAALWGHKAMAITDHGVAQAFPLALHEIEGKKMEDFKLIYGMEAYYVNDAANVTVVKGRKDGDLDGKFICFDLETTGLKPTEEEITEIAAVLVEDGQVRDAFQTYVNPHKPVPPKITELTGISDETVADAPELSDALAQFFAFCGDLPLVAHNANFDMSFLKIACERLQIQKDFTSIDTLEMSRLMLPELSKYKLNILAKHLQVGPFEHHRASEDAAVLGRIFIKLLEKLKMEDGAQKISDINGVLAGRRDKSGSVKNLKRHHFIILVKNQVGLKNLYKLISFSFLNHFYKKPLIPRSELIKYREGLIYGSACEAGELFRAIVDDRPWEELLEIASFYDYLEIQPIGNNAYMLEKGIAKDEEQLRDFNRKVLKLADALGKPCCATGDVHFLEPEDEAFRRILMAGQGFADADKQPPLYFKTTDEMLEEFSYLGEDRALEVVVTNPNKIADSCDFVRPVPRENYPPKIEGSAEDLENMCREKAKRMYGDPLPEIVQKRLDRELGSIIGNGYDVMYIIAQKLVCKSIEDGYLVGSRGSVGSSLAAFMSDITEVNSLAPHYLCPECKYVEFHENEGVGCGVDLPDKICPKCGTKMRKEGFSIPFETFLGFNGDKVPDIDLNFSGEYQSQIHWYTGELFGHDHVFRAGTIGTIAEKTAYGYVKKYMAERGITANRAEENRLSAGCTGVRRTSGQHPGGIVVVPKEVEIYDFCPVQHPADDPDSDIITTHFEYHSIDANLLKLDELGHDDPTIIRHLEDLTGVNAREIPLDDPETMSLFTSNEALHYVEEGDDPILGHLGCVAVPEFGTKFVRGMVRDTKPTSFDDLLCISGLSHGTDVWLGNAQLLVQKGIPLKECICCRDDIMNYLIGKGVEPSLAFKTMESVRKGKGLKPEMEEAMLAQNVPDWYIDSCKKIKYMFPKAHAVAYVMMAFRIAWFKVHYPLAFYSAYFSIRAKGFDASCMIRGDQVCLDKFKELKQKESDKTISAAEKEMQTTLEVCHEFYRRGFQFAPMDVYESDAVNFLVTENGLRPPFTSMPGIGEQAARAIVEERKNGKFLSVEELTMRCPKVSKAVAELLEQIGALQGMPKSTQISFF
jgi:DNA polymerase-3 subunit alpha (Gram-positive type)